MVRGMQMHVVRRKNGTLQRITGKSDKTHGSVSGAIIEQHGVLAKNPQKPNKHGKDIDGQQPEHRISPPADAPGQTDKECELPGRDQENLDRPIGQSDLAILLFASRQITQGRHQVAEAGHKSNKTHWRVLARMHVFVPIWIGLAADIAVMIEMIAAAQARDAQDRSMHKEITKQIIDGKVFKEPLVHAVMRDDVQAIKPGADNGHR